MQVTFSSASQPNSIMDPFLEKARQAFRFFSSVLLCSKRKAFFLAYAKLRRASRLLRMTHRGMRFAREVAFGSEAHSVSEVSCRREVFASRARKNAPIGAKKARTNFIYTHQSQGNTAQFTAVALITQLLASFPSHCTNFRFSKKTCNRSTIARVYLVCLTKKLTAN